MSLKLNEEKGLFYLSYTSDPVHTHSSAEIVEMAKLKYGKLNKSKVSKSTNIDVQPGRGCLDNESDVGNDEDGTNNQALRVRAAPSGLVTFHYPISDQTIRERQLKTSSLNTNGQTTPEEHVQVKVNDDDYDFSENSGYDFSDNYDDNRDNMSSQEHDTSPWFCYPNHRRNFYDISSDPCFGF
ncbi:unnamed protein product [Ambrosiozyma monospora]|uniref:Unnamed protein product n=1 Tax=Ambrosiozyma monospora TaxID=43982 RepID=A0ACB5SU25_AMBMO|nr:unnamed protein product [Ambrosiozyma monospora]